MPANGTGPGMDAGAQKVPYESKQTTDKLPAIDVRELKRVGAIASGQERVEGVARLAWTPCNFGGGRPWFVCPGIGCERRVAILYGPDPRGRRQQQQQQQQQPQPPQPLCRRCRNLAYESQREDALARAERRLHKARERLPQDGIRPKRMRHATFEKLLDEYTDAWREHEARRRERFGLTWGGDTDLFA